MTTTLRYRTALLGYLALAFACGTGATSSPVVSDSGTPSVPGASGQDAAQDAAPQDAPPEDASTLPDVVDALAEGPSFTVSPGELAIDSAAAPAGESPFYAAHLDSTTPEGGRATMLLESTAGASTSTFAATTAVRTIDASVAGRRYRMRAKIRTEQAEAGFLWWRIDVGRSYKIDNMGNPENRRITGTSDWQELSLVMDVPEAAGDFAFGSGLKGQGKIWVSAITFENVGADVPETPHFGTAE